MRTSMEPRPSSQGVEDPSRAAYGFAGVDAFERTFHLPPFGGTEPPFSLFLLQKRFKPADYSSRLISAPAHRLHLPSPILLHSTRFLVSFPLRSNRARTDTFVYDSKGISLSLSLSLFPSLNLKLADGNGEEGEKDNISRSYNGINSKSEFSNSVLLPRYPSCSSFSILFGAELVAGTIAGTRES